MILAPVEAAKNTRSAAALINEIIKLQSGLTQFVDWSFIF